MFNIIITFFIISLFHSLLFSQTEESDRFKNYFSFDVNLNKQDNIRYQETLKGKGQIKFYSKFGYEIGVEFHRFIKNKTEIGIGVKQGKMSYSYKIDIIENDSLLDYVFKGTYIDSDVGISNMYLNPTFSMKQNFSFKKEFYFIELGIGLNLIYPYKRTINSVWIGNNADEKLIYRSITQGRDKWINPSTYIRVGSEKKIKKHIFRYGLIYNYMINYLRKGTYQFMNIDSPSSGILKVKLNYIGIVVDYCIGVARKNKSS